jgi:hypothetical protein
MAAFEGGLSSLMRPLNSLERSRSELEAPHITPGSPGSFRCVRHSPWSDIHRGAACADVERCKAFGIAIK